MKEYKIYAISDPDTNIIKYIGVTTRTLKERLYQHLYNARNKRLQISAKWIWSLLKVDKLPVISLVETCTETNWEEREKYWIAYYGKQLHNQDPGGRGVVFKNKKSNLSSQMAKYKCVYQLDNKGVIINKFDSVMMATKFFNGKSHSNIPNVLKGRVNTAYGFYWCYCNEYKQYKKRVFIKPPTCTGKVIATNIITNKSKQFKSATDAAIQIFGLKNCSLGVNRAAKSGKVYKDYKFERLPTTGL